MGHSIKTVYVVHHSHTDIGYTDLQEHVIDGQANYLRTVLSIMEKPENKDFRWNCETYFCVEEFLKTATDAEKEKFFSLICENKVGMSATYLNFTDLVDSDVYNERVAEMMEIFKARGISLTTAMIADINGISMGQRDAMINNGVEFLYTNIHCHHGMYPLYQNQTAYLWENADGKSLLVWNGEHYNLGNALGIKPNRGPNFMTENYFGDGKRPTDAVDMLNESLEQYLTLCEENVYPYDFVITSVSGVFSDNAPPETEILRTIDAFNAKYSSTVNLQMVSLQELYALIKNKLVDVPVLHGDLNDWWANGVGSTPYAVKHYKDAQHRYHLCERMDADFRTKYPELTRIAQDNLLLYAEHTWGHSSTIVCPYDTMVLNLDMRKNSYASKAHEATSRILNRIAEEKGDILRYYNTNGKVKVRNTNSLSCKQAVEFYIESGYLANARINAADGSEIKCQTSPHPRGRRISFVDSFKPYEEKNYTYTELPEVSEGANSRKAYMGSDRVRDIVNDYDAESYKLPYAFENDFFKLSYRPHEGITSFINKKSGKEMLSKKSYPFFTPLYERTEIRRDYSKFPCKEEVERRLMGRNIRGEHSELFVADLKEIIRHERGDVFSIIELKFSLEGAVHCSVFVKFFNEIPKIDFKLELGKTISSDIESVFLPLTLDLQKSEIFIKKGEEAFRPGIDQLPGTCMEFFMSDDGLGMTSDDGNLLIATKDTPLLYMGEMRHHPITLCDGKAENNQRPVYSWIMNNNWETNFKMDLSGFCEYMYSLSLTSGKDGVAAMDELRELQYVPYVLITE